MISPRRVPNFRPVLRVRSGRVLRTLLLVLLGVVAIVLLVAAVALPPLARSKTRQALAGMNGARGQFQDVSVSLFPLRYAITRLKISRTDALVDQPSFYAERLAVTLRWAPLLKGVFAARIDGDRVKAVLEEPKPGPDTPLPTLTELIPVRAVIERVQLRDSEVLYAWVRKEGRPMVWAHRIEATLENLASRAPLQEGPTVIAARGLIGGKGTVWFTVTADPWAERLTFAGNAGAEGFDPSQLNAYLSPYQNIQLTPGSYSMKMSFRSEDGKLTGAIDPHLVGTELRSDGDVGSALKVFFGKIVLANSGPTEGTRASGRIAVRDDLSDPKLQLAPRLEKVIENGFSLGLQESLKRDYAGKTEASDKPEPTPLKAKK
ncbi:MAG TPA: hypothetical protein VFN91_00545 [Myxococcaceae bacterium]|nr:hypothetical protein [Myxococcaceae bacterium]